MSGPLSPEAAALRISALEAENDTLRERLRVLESEFCGAEWLAPAEFALTPSEARILAVLIFRDWATKEQLFAAQPRPDPDAAPNIKIVDVWICKIRAKLKPYGIEILTMHGRGYKIEDAEVRRRLREGWNVRRADTLRACAFCGAEGELSPLFYGDGIDLASGIHPDIHDAAHAHIAAGGSVFWEARCTCCEARVAPISESGITGFNTRRLAIEAWNMRPEA